MTINRAKRGQLRVSFTFLAHFISFHIAANQTACHLNILKAYAGQVKNSPISNFSQLNQLAQNAATRRQNHAAMRRAGGKMPPKAHKTMTEGKAHPTVEKAHQWKSSDHRGKSSGADFRGAQRADKRFAEKAGESSRDAALGRWQGIINALDICAW